MKIIIAVLILAVAFWIGGKAGHVMDRKVAENIQHPTSNIQRSIEEVQP
jgi:hypothetical protein